MIQQKEFIKYLEDEIKLYENDIRNFSKYYKGYDQASKFSSVTRDGNSQAERFP